MGLFAHLATARGTMWVPDARVEDSQIVINLGNGGDRGAGVVGAGFLVDRNCGRKTCYLIYIGLLHLPQELSRICRKRLHVFPLSFGEYGIEGERRLPRA